MDFTLKNMDFTLKKSGSPAPPPDYLEPRYVPDKIMNVEFEMMNVVSRMQGHTRWDPRRKRAILH